MTVTEVGFAHRIDAIVERMRRSLEGLVALGLGDVNGLPIAFLGPTTDKEAATAMASLVVSAAQRAAQALGLPAVREVLIDTEGYRVLVHPIGERFTLVAILTQAADLEHGKLLLETTCDDIRIALES